MTGYSYKELEYSDRAKQAVKSPPPLIPCYYQKYDHVRSDSYGSVLAIRTLGDIFSVHVVVDDCLYSVGGPGNQIQHYS